MSTFISKLLKPVEADTRGAIDAFIRSNQAYRESLNGPGNVINARTDRINKEQAQAAKLAREAEMLQLERDRFSELKSSNSFNQSFKEKELQVERDKAITNSLLKKLQMKEIKSRMSDAETLKKEREALKYATRNTYGFDPKSIDDKKDELEGIRAERDAAFKTIGEGYKDITNKLDYAGLTDAEKVDVDLAFEKKYGKSRIDKITKSIDDVTGTTQYPKGPVFVGTHLLSAAKPAIKGISNLFKSDKQVELEKQKQALALKNKVDPDKLQKEKDDFKLSLIEEIRNKRNAPILEENAETAKYNLAAKRATQKYFNEKAVKDATPSLRETKDIMAESKAFVDNWKKDLAKQGKVPTIYQENAMMDMVIKKSQDNIATTKANIAKRAEEASKFSYEKQRMEIQNELAKNLAKYKDELKMLEQERGTPMTQKEQIDAIIAIQDAKLDYGDMKEGHKALMQSINKKLKQ